MLAIRLGELAGASAQELADTYCVALLHSSGCTSDGCEAAQLYGDDIVPRAAFALDDPGNPAEVLAFLTASRWPGSRWRCAARWRNGSPGGSPSARAPRGLSNTSSSAETGWDSQASRAATRFPCRCGRSPDTKPGVQGAYLPHPSAPTGAAETNKGER